MVCYLCVLPFKTYYAPQIEVYTKNKNKAFETVKSYIRTIISILNEFKKGILIPSINRHKYNEVNLF